LNSPQPPEPTVFTIDSFHVRQMTVVETGSPAQMKRCLLNLPSLLLPLYGTYVTSGWERNSFQAMAMADVVIGVTGTVANGAMITWDTEMTVLKNRTGPQGQKVRGQMEYAVMLDEANFRLEPHGHE